MKHVQKTVEKPFLVFLTANYNQFLRKHVFPEKTAVFHENQAFRGFREFLARREKHVSKMCPGENFSFASPNNF